METNRPDSKVLFRVGNDDGSEHVETLWATSLGEDLYCLENSPFFAYGVSWQDIVFAPFSEDEGFPLFQRVQKASGRRTLRVVLNPPAEEENDSVRILQSIVELGGTYEGANTRYFVIDIEKEENFWPICGYLSENEVQWEHANPVYRDLYPDDA